MRGPYEGKYRRLRDYLRALAEPVATMTFNQIEGVIGFDLPQSARTHQAWWANQDRGQSLSWVREGFRTSKVSVDDERLTFLRADVPDQEAGIEFEPLTIAEAKQRLAFTLGIDPSQIEISIHA